MAAAALLLALIPAKADTRFTFTGWLTGVPLPGIQCTNGSGQVYLKGNVHTVRVLASSPLATGRLEAWMDMAYQADGTAIFAGPAYLEAGTWDSTGTNFTASGGVWDMTYSGVVHADGSDTYKLVGYGVGGAIEGQRILVNATRAAGPPFDPTIPYQGSGTIKPAPVNTRLVVDDFADNLFTWPLSGAGSGSFNAIETDQQLTLRGTWTSPTWNLSDHMAWTGQWRNWSVPDGQTVELRADLVSLNQSATAAMVALYHDWGQGYGFMKAGSWVVLLAQKGGPACFRAGQIATSNTNVVIALSITPSGQNVILTGRIIDKQTGAILHQITAVDTPAEDPALSPAELAQITGCQVWHDFGPDIAGAPWKNGNSVELFLVQDTDGTLPPAEATFDNIELLAYAVPQLSIERAVRLSWPATGTNFRIEAAPTVNGPWLPVLDPVIPNMNQLTVPGQWFHAIFPPRAGALNARLERQQNNQTPAPNHKEVQVSP